MTLKIPAISLTIFTKQTDSQYSDKFEEKKFSLEHLSVTSVNPNTFQILYERMSQIIHCRFLCGLVGISFIRRPFSFASVMQIGCKTFVYRLFV